MGWSIEGRAMSTQAQTIVGPAETTTWKGRALAGLLAVQIIVGFEFFWTVLVKLVRGGFVSGLAADLQTRVEAAPGWYRSLAHNVIIPNATLFGYLIIAGELFVGITLMATAIVWLVRWDSLSLTARRTLVGLIVLAAAAALAMNVNYHIANGATNPWRLPAEVFDEGVDINSILTFIDAVLIVVMAGVLLSLRSGGVKKGRDAA
jgi:hypothetical protein